MELLEIKNLYKNYGEKQVLNNITLTVPRGKIIGLLGISGTGKSRIVRKLAQATITENLQKIYDPDSVKEGFNRWSIHKPANYELIQVKPNWTWILNGPVP